MSDDDRRISPAPSISDPPVAGDDPATRPPSHAPTHHPAPAAGSEPEAGPTFAPRVEQDAAVSPPRPRRRWGMVVALAVVSVVLLGAVAAAVWLFVQLGQARDRIDEQNDEIREQREQIDKKESFGAAMAGLRETIAPLTGLPFTDLVPWSHYDRLAARAWEHRRDVAAMDRDIEAVNAATAEIAQKREAARAQASSNASGSVWEETLDRLGSGWVATTLADASSACEGDALACVYDSDPFVVRVNTDGGAGDGMTDWIRTGAAYHEFAHVLQNLNPDATATALESFEGDWETMADCYALTMLPGWSLEHEVPINAYEYWEVSVGYGYTCDDDQRQVIRDWNASLAVVMRTIGG